MVGSYLLRVYSTLKYMVKHYSNYVCKGKIYIWISSLSKLIVLSNVGGSHAMSWRLE